MQLDLLFTTYADLFARIQQRPPDVVEIAALAIVLHSFYNDVESIFLAGARQRDQSVPDDPRWHRVLLSQMTQPTPTRPAVISAALEMHLTDYLAFRHYFRHAYTFMLDWARRETDVRAGPYACCALRSDQMIVLRSAPALAAEHRLPRLHVLDGTPSTTAYLIAMQSPATFTCGQTCSQTCVKRHIVWTDVNQRMSC